MVSDILKTFQRRLTNLTAKNKSLYLSGIIKSQFLDIQELDFLENKPAFFVIEQILNKRKKIALCNVIDSTYTPNNPTSKQLLQIVRTHKSILEECGADDLRLGYPFVQGKTLQDTPIRCPLLFFPVSLQIENGKWYLFVKENSEISWNKTFFLAYAHDNPIKYQEDSWNELLEHIPRQVDDFLIWLYQVLKEGELEIHFNPQLFEKRLYPFQKYTQKEFAETFQTGKLQLFPSAVLGIFPQTDSYLSPDYQTLIQQTQYLSDNDLEFLFVKHPYPTNSKKEIKEKDLLAPLHLDAWQEEAMKRIKSGESLLIQGPPGSGKSELICNIIADAIANNKNVLVVCQKKAALDIVKERLHQISIEKFVALLHDIQLDRSRIFEQILHQISSLSLYQQQNISLDAIRIEREFDKICQSIDEIVQELNRFKTALYDTSICGISIKELYLQTTPTPALPYYLSFRFDSETYFHTKSRLLAHFSYRFRFCEQHQWRNRQDFSQFTSSDLLNIQNLLHRLSDDFLYFKRSFENIFHQDIDFSTLVEIAENYPVIQAVFSSEIPTWKLEYAQKLFFKPLDCTFEIITSEILQILQNQSFAPLHIPEQIEDFLQKIQKGLRLCQYKISAWWWRRYSTDYQEIEPYLTNKKNLKEALKHLLFQIENHLKVQIGLQTLAEQTDIDFFPALQPGINFFAWKITFQKWCEHIKQADAFRSLISKFPFVLQKRLLNDSFKEFQKWSLSFLELATEWQKYFAKVHSYITLEQWKTWIENPSSLAQAQHELQRDFDALCQADAIYQQFSSVEHSVIEYLEKQSFETPQAAVEHFENALKSAWIEHIERQFPELRIVSSGRIEFLEQQLIELVQAKQQLAQKIILMKARQRTFQNLALNRLHHRITYRELEHQVRKKRAVWTIRKLIHQFYDEIFRLIPCWLASPETVSAVFPLCSLFDIVVFDEASQCFAEKGILALWRAKQIVICGDRQQLPPFDLYKPRWEDDTQENIVLESESLLDLAEKYLPQIMLRGHYRSQSLELIDFSNRHFYQQKLTMVPHYENILKTDEPAIHYIKVEGFWENGANLIEAQKVLQLVENLLRERRNNIGIITFNYKQQNLIEDLLEQHLYSKPEELFIKNIENVQGDERDYIIFSVGYAPSPSGKFSMNFGLLNQLKGENRLNVAITRARKKIWVVTSIFPSALRADETTHDGVKLLQKYLQYAYEVSNGNYTPSLPSPSFEPTWYLKQKLTTIFSQLKIYYPFADLTEFSRQQPIALWLTDDDTYAERCSKDAHAYQLIHFQEKKWNYKRVFSRNYFIGKIDKVFCSNYYENK
ncbi:MAG: AAA domain-containing protein [Cytophagales bacterium]|nr:AAA domain-containing protein [Cytophagales bacterium]MDW8384021.1 AAA domain-containing protein [Flammeovirgaceae bacterium]